MAFVPGWSYQPKEIEAVREEFRSEGRSPFLADGRPELKDYHKRVKKTRICAAELILFGGQFLPSWLQHRGTCVGQGTARTCQSSNNAALAYGKIAGTPQQMCPEVIYAGSRVQIGNGRLGRGDGSIGGWAARFVHKYGLVPRGVYGPYDLRQPQEMLGVDWGNPGRGVPDVILNDPRVRGGVSAFEAQSIEDAWDGMAADDAATALCCDTLFSGRRDSNGCLRPSGSGGHCTELVDFVEDMQGQIITIYQQSWGDDAITGTDVIKCSDGSEYKLGPGRCGVYPDDMHKIVRSDSGCEMWVLTACDPWTDGVNPGEMA